MWLLIYNRKSSEKVKKLVKQTKKKKLKLQTNITAEVV